MEIHNMLILTRRLGETLIIGDDVQVTVLGVRGHQVRLGVNAPKEISVHREEIYRRIKEEGDRKVQPQVASDSQTTNIKIPELAEDIDYDDNRGNC